MTAIKVDFNAVDEKRLVRITSPKHPGAIFFLRRRPRENGNRNDDFVCKFYSGHDADAALFAELPFLLGALESIVGSRSEYAHNIAQAAINRLQAEKKKHTLTITGRFPTEPEMQNIP